MKLDEARVIEVMTSLGQEAPHGMIIRKVFKKVIYSVLTPRFSLKASSV